PGAVPGGRPPPLGSDRRRTGPGYAGGHRPGRGPGQGSGRNAARTGGRGRGNRRGDRCEGRRFRRCSRAYTHERGTGMLNEIVQHGGRVIIQGITGGYARSQAARMLAYGTPVVAGVTPGRGGENLAGVPIFNTVQAAVDATGATVSVLYVPAPGGRERAWEAMDAGIRLLVIPSEGVPVHDAMKLRALARQRGCWIVGPNTAGIIWPGRLLLGSLAPDDAVPGPVALISRSGTLSFEMVRL